MVNIYEQMGMENVESDPNNVPDGAYAGTVSKSEIVATKKDKVAHAITYRVSDGKYKGAQVTEWFTLGDNPEWTQGEYGTKTLTGFTPTMSEQQRVWYKKRFTDFGLSEASGTLQQAMGDVSQLENAPVTFGVKKNNGYVNVSFVELRNTEASVQATTPNASFF